MKKSDVNIEDLPRGIHRVFEGDEDFDAIVLEMSDMCTLRIARNLTVGMFAEIRNRMSPTETESMYEATSGQKPYIDRLLLSGSGPRDKYGQGTMMIVTVFAILQMIAEVSHQVVGEGDDIMKSALKKGFESMPESLDGETTIALSLHDLVPLWSMMAVALSPDAETALRDEEVTKALGDLAGYYESLAGENGMASMNWMAAGLCHFLCQAAVSGPKCVIDAGHIGHGCELDEQHSH